MTARYEVVTCGCTVTCPWHFAQFDLATGAVVDGVASAPVRVYQTEVRDGVIFVGTPAKREA